jgi:hypothetical protein
MRQKTLRLLLCAIIFGLQSQCEIIGGQDAVSQVSKSAELPAHVVYEFYFLRVAFLFSKLSAGERVDGALPKSFRTEITGPEALEYSQEQAIHQVALTCLGRARELDLKARAIIREALSGYHGGKLRKGQAPPAIPPELRTMQAERNIIFVNGRESLKKQLGDQRFRELDRFVSSTIGQQQ